RKLSIMNSIKTDIPESLLVIPPYESKKQNKRENNNIPDVDSLTEEQKEVYNQIIKYLNGELKDVNMIALKGFAGTGKTYLITQVLKWYVLMIQNNISVTAPTNKAVKILRSTANFEHPLISYKTIHKLLGLKEKIDEKTGKISFEKDFDSPSDIDNNDVVILDETSMLNDRSEERRVGKEC